MPNWCEYSLEIKGDPEVIAQLHEVFSVPTDEQPEPSAWDDSDGRYDISRARPCPEELQVTATFIDTTEPQDDPEKEALRLQYLANYEKYGHKDWYHWQIDKWGTKWAPGVGNYEYDMESNGIYISGESAWSPPSELVRYITEQYPVKAILTYQEGGMCFGGVESYVGGGVAYNGYFEYDNVPRLQLASAELDTDDEDAWQEAYENFRDELDIELGERESLAAMAVDWSTTVS